MTKSERVTGRLSSSVRGGVWCRKELIGGFLEMAMRYNTKERELMQLCNLAAVQKLSFDSFTNKLRSLVEPEFMRFWRTTPL